MTRPECLAAMRDALGKIGCGGLAGMPAIEAYATCHQLLGRLEAMEEMEARPGRFPRPIIETLDPLTFEDVEIAPLLTRQQEIEGAFHQAVDETFERAWRDFRGGEDSDANIEAVNDFLGRITSAKPCGG